MGILQERAASFYAERGYGVKRDLRGQKKKRS